MKAIVISRPGGPEVLEEQEHPLPEPGPGEVRVRVRASALNRADLAQRRGKYPAPPGAAQEIPGLEYAGEVDALGPRAALRAVGDRVMGIVGGGGHAEYVVVHERETVSVPENLSWEEAAALPEVFMTAFDALFHRLDLQLGERLLIHAVGSGVGTAALQLARSAGAIVLGTSRTAEKLERARELGLHLGIDSSAEDVVEAVLRETEGAGVDAVLNLTGGRTIEDDLRVVSTRGRIALVGTMAGARADLDLGMMLRKRIQLTGTVLRTRPLEEKIALAREFSRRVLPLLSAGQICPIIDRTYPFSEIADAHRYMEANENFGKIVLLW